MAKIRISRTTAFLVLFALVIGTLANTGSTIKVAHASTGYSNTGIVEPLYVYPSSNSYWSGVYNAKSSYSTVPFAAIINIYNGPGTSCCDTNYESGIQYLHGVGVIELGYVYTSNCGRMLSSVENDIYHWTKWYKSYGISGIFEDEMQQTGTYSSCSGGITAQSYYSTLYSVIHNSTNGYKWAFGNPGANTANSYSSLTSVVDVLDNYENSAGTLPTQNSTLVGGSSVWTIQYSKQAFSFIVGSRSSLPSATTMKEYMPYVGWLFIGNDSAYTHIPSYISTEASDLSYSSVQMRLVSKTTAGVRITGYNIATYQPTNGSPCSGSGYAPNYCEINSGYTTIKMNATSGWQYAFYANSFGGCNFQYWDTSGNTANPLIVTAPSSNSTHIAYYSGTC